MSVLTRRKAKEMDDLAQLMNSVYLTRRVRAKLQVPVPSFELVRALCFFVFLFFVAPLCSSKIIRYDLFEFGLSCSACIATHTQARQCDGSSCCHAINCHAINCCAIS
jgi:hypothetical protein